MYKLPEKTFILLHRFIHSCTHSYLYFIWFMNISLCLVRCNVNIWVFNKFIKHYRQFVWISVMTVSGTNLIWWFLFYPCKLASSNSIQKQRLFLSLMHLRFKMRSFCTVNWVLVQIYKCGSLLNDNFSMQIHVLKLFKQ